MSCEGQRSNYFRVNYRHESVFDFGSSRAKLLSVTLFYTLQLSGLQRESIDKQRKPTSIETKDRTLK